MAIRERLNAPVRQSFAFPFGGSRKKLLVFVGAAFLFLASPSYAATLGTTAGAPDPSSSFTATTGLFSSTSGAVSITSAGTEMMRVNGTGVGIGTTSPGYKLDVQDSSSSVIRAKSTGVNSWARLDLTNPNRSLFITNNAADGVVSVYYDTSNRLQFDTSNQWFNTGSLGIGTTVPDAILSLSGQSAQTIDMVRDTTASTAGNNLTVQAGGAVSGGTNLNGGTLNLTSGISTGTGSSGINFKIYEPGSTGAADNAATTAMTVTGTGNVGIGMTSPGGILSVANSSGAEQFRVSSAANAVNYIAVTGQATGLQPRIYIDGSDTNIAGVLATKGSSSWQIGTGSTGVGTSWAEQVRINHTAGANAFLTLTGGNSASPTISTSAQGLNLTSAAGAVAVTGTLSVSSFAANSSTTVCQNANVLSTCTSARRYKEKIEASPLGLKEVLAMKPVTFDLKDHKDNWERHDFGFIAEDMEAINPLFVTYDEDDEVSGVRYMQLTAVNTKAIQELHGEEVKDVAELQGEISDLKLMIERLIHQK